MKNLRAALRRSLATRTRPTPAADRPSRLPAPAGLEPLEGRVLLSSVTLTNDLDYAIPDGQFNVRSPIFSQLPSGAVITGLDVDFRITHPRGSDLAISLERGDGRMISSNSTQVPNPAGTVTGIDTFNGLDGTGGWGLRVYDLVPGSSGYIDSWSLTIHYDETGLPQPPTLGPGVTLGSGQAYPTLPLTPTLTWQSVSGATGYRVYVRTMREISYALAAGASSFTIPNGVIPADGRGWRWSVSAVGGTVEGPRSEPRFAYSPTPLSAPTTISPGEPTGVIPLVSSPQPTFSWQSVPGASGYKVYLRNTLSGQQSSYASATTSYILPTGQLATSNRYEWWAVSVNQGVESAPSTKRHFNTPAHWVQPPFPTLPDSTRPDAPMPVSADKIAFHFISQGTSGATAFRIHARDLDTQQRLTFDVPTTTTIFTPPAGAFLVDHRYGWHLTSLVGNVEGAPSPEWYFRIAPPTATPTKLTGTVIGTAGSYKNRGATRDRVFDGDTSTYFDGPSSSGVWVGLDLGSEKTITKARYVPRSGSPDRMVGGRFQVSSNGTTWTDLGTITQTPGSSWNELSFANPNAYRYVRYLSPSGSYGNVAEIEFWGAGGTPPALTPADLVTQNLIATPNTSTAGESSPVNVRFTVRNTGQTASARSSLVIDLINAPGSTTPTYLDTLLPGLTIPSIPAGGSYEFNENVTIDASTPAGQYLIRLTLDPNRNAGQSGSGLDNDVTTGGFTIDPATPVLTPDLVVQNVDTGFNTAVQGGTFNLYFGVRNLGAAASTTTTARAVLRNASGQQVAVLASDYAIAGLGVNAYAFFPRTLTIPASVPPGTYSVAIQIDVAGTAGQPAAAKANDTFVTPLTFTVTANPNQPQTPAKLTGAVIGTTGSYKNRGATRDRVFDGDLSTYFDGPSSSGVWVGLDLGSAKTITKARYVPRSGSPDRMVGGDFQASIDGVNWIDLGTITQTPGSSWNELNFSNTNAYRYVRYLSPAGSYGNVAELEFWGTGGGPGTPIPAADLVAQNVVPAKSSVVAGDTLAASFSIRNQGDGDSKGLLARIFLRDAAGGETTLASGISFPSIVAGGTYAYSRSMTVPAHLPPGTYTVGVQVDTSGTGMQAPGANANDVTLSTATVTVTAPTGEPGAATKLTGTVIGTAGSYKNRGNTRDKAFDGNTSTYFDGPTSSNVWAGLDLGTAKTITKARYVPRAGLASRMVGGKFQASIDGVTWIDLGTITQTPGAAWNEMSFTNANAHRYVRYLGPSGSSGNVAELEFWGTA